MKFWNYQIKIWFYSLFIIDDNDYIWIIKVIILFHYTLFNFLTVKTKLKTCLEIETKPGRIDLSRSCLHLISVSILKISTETKNNLFLTGRTILTGINLDKSQLSRPPGLIENLNEYLQA